MTHKRQPILSLFLMFFLFSGRGVSPAATEETLLTVAEASGFSETSRYDDVLRLIRELQRRSPLVRVETLCVSTEGRAVPLLVIGRPAPASPQALRYDERLVVYIQANIHAGEVEGKEASLMLAREILLEKNHPYLDQLVILIAPIFNADGNEKISPSNRRGQAGPEKGVGVRHNGQNLDLNRDSTKLESPELQGLVKNVLMRWDPALLVDCHTTNGSYHEEPVTYSWPLNPNSDTALIAYQREKMLPRISEILEKKYNTLSIPYGNFDYRNIESGWQTFSPQPRFVTNYMGLRNRLAILNENYSYADFRTRVLGCYHFLLAILDYCTENSGEIKALAAEADRMAVERGHQPKDSDTFGVEFDVRPLKEKVTIRSWEMEIIPREGSWPQVKRTDRKKTYVLPYMADFVPGRSVRFPFGYLIEPADPEIQEKLLQHGLLVEKLIEPVKLDVESFQVKELKAAERLYQGHYMNTVKGEYVTEEKEFPAGTLFVSTAQPLANVAACLLEPESDDGLFVWNFFDRYLVPQWGRAPQTCPVYRVLKPVNLVKERVR